jgi:hypothetical protein
MSGLLYGLQNPSKADKLGLALLDKRERIDYLTIAMCEVYEGNCG